MKKHSLNSTGLSLSQAQSISNMCNQRSIFIQSKINAINNGAMSAKIDDDWIEMQQAIPVPDNIVDLLKEKAQLSATQAFLMENIKAKEALLNEQRTMLFISQLNKPEEPMLMNFTPIPMVGESWGWSQLSVNEINEYYEAEAYAAHIGQFIHADGKLSELRKNVNDITLSYQKLNNQPVLVKLFPCHTDEGLINIYEELAKIHRKYEQRVNYFKAKVKNLVAEENIRISQENKETSMKVHAHNQPIIDEYNNQLRKYEALQEQERQEFEKGRQQKLKEISALRIQVDVRFQPVIDKFTKELTPE